MNNIAKNNGLCTGACLLGHVKLRVLWGLAQVLVHVSTVKINVCRSKRVRWNQLVVTVNEINRFYMQCKDSLLQHDMIFLPFTIKL